MKINYFETQTQTYTSAATSINSVKLPAVYSRVELFPGESVLDYGCGRYVNHLQNFVNCRGCGWKGYDPFNYPTEIPGYEHFDVVICSNVLNVIDSDFVVDEILSELAWRCRATGRCYISIYEGDRTGNGRPTKADCYQRNQKTRDYLPMIYRHFKSCYVSGNVITCYNPDR